MQPTLESIIAAHKRLSPHLLRTPLLYSDFYSDSLSEASGQVFLKLESEQLTGSFKARGAYNKVLLYSEARKAFTTASSGNHAAGVVSALKKFGAQGDIYLPLTASPTKVKLLQRMVGSNSDIRLVRHGNDCSIAEAEARKQAEETSKIYLSPYNDADVVSGQGTIGIEILEQMKEVSPDNTNVDFVFVAVGGGGLIGGISLYFNEVAPNTKIIGCQPANDNAMQQCVAAGKIFDIQAKETLSDGTAGNVEEGSITFSLCQKYVHQFCTVEEGAIGKEILNVLEWHHKLIEGAAGCALATLFHESLVSELGGKTIVVVICGSNLGTETLEGLLKDK